MLVRAGEISSCQAVVVGLSPAAGPNAGWTFRGKAMTGALGPANILRLTVAEVEELWSRGEEFTVDCLEGSRSYLNLDAIARCGIQHFLVFPFFRDGTISGLLGLGYTSTPDTAGHDAGRIRRFVDQVTVALSNARLVEEVSDLNWGTVRALARTIDAISPWTAGHSERVTGLALSVGRELGLSKRKLDVLHRGGLLHDIGKIAIDPAILNKEGRLDDNEFAIMQRHPALGAEILAPVPQYADVLPIVLHHHEKVDGTGYPHGLRGNNIPFLARILAVADVYDALRSPRPYRPSLTEAEVVEEIRKMSGTHLDRLVVDAFLKVKGRHEPRENGEIPELTLDLQAFYARTD